MKPQTHVAKWQTVQSNLKCVLDPVDLELAKASCTSSATFVFSLLLADLKSAGSTGSASRMAVMP